MFLQISFTLSSYWCWDYFVLFTMSYLVIEGGASNLRLINGLCNWQKSVSCQLLWHLRFRRSFWGDEQVWILIGSKVMTQTANISISTPVANLMHHPIWLSVYILYPSRSQRTETVCKNKWAWAKLRLGEIVCTSTWCQVWISANFIRK